MVVYTLIFIDARFLSKLSFHFGKGKYVKFDIVKLVNPCHLLISVAKKDKWSRDAKEIYKYAKNKFKNSELILKIWPGDHRFSKEMRNKAYKFLIEKLKN